MTCIQDFHSSADALKHMRMHFQGAQVLNINQDGTVTINGEPVVAANSRTAAILRLLAKQVITFPEMTVCTSAHAQYLYKQTWLLSIRQHFEDDAQIFFAGTGGGNAGFGADFWSTAVEWGDFARKSVG